MKKRILTFLVVLSLLLNVPAFAINDDPAKLNAYDVIKTLGMKNKVYEADALITRAQFSELIYYLANMDDTDATAEWNDDYFVDEEDELGLKTDIDTEYIFNDVKVDNEYYNAINQLYKRGYVSGDTDTQFRPDDAIKYEEGVAILINIAGYKDIANESAGYPNGYIKTAAGLGMLNDLNMNLGHQMTAKDAAELIYNSFDVEVAYKLETMTDNENYVSTEEITVLDEIFGLYRIKGVVTENELTSYYAKSTIGENRIKIGSEIFDLAEDYQDAWRLIGRNVEGFYREGEYDEKVIEYLAAYKSDKSETFYSEDGLRLENGKIYYNTNKNEREKNFDIGTPIIYNGISVSSYEPKVIDEGSVTIIENNLGETVIVVWDYKTAFVSNVNYEERKIYSAYEIGETFDLDSSYYKSIVYNSNGEQVTFNDIVPSSVITYAMNSAGCFVAHISENKITGKIESTRFNANEMTIDGKTYTISEEFMNATNKPAMDIGNEMTVYLDVSGRIAWMSTGADAEAENGWSHAIFATSYSDRLGPAYIEIFSTDGEFVTYPMKNKVSFNDKDGNSTRINTESEQILLTQGEYIRIHVNADGLVDKIEQPLLKASDASDNRSHRIVKDRVTQKWDKYSASFNGSIFANSSTIVFKIPSSGSTNIEEDWDVGKASFTHWSKNYEIDAFTTVKDSPVAEILIQNEAKVDKTWTDPNTRKLSVVTSIGEALVDGEVLRQVDCVTSAGVSVTYYGEYVKTDASGNTCTVFDVARIIGDDENTAVVGIGDIIRCDSVNVKKPDYMTVVQLIYDADAANPHNTDGRMGYLAGKDELCYVNVSAVDVTNDIFNRYSVTKSLKGGNPFTFNNYAEELETGHAYRPDANDRYTLGYVYSKSGDLYKITTQDICQMPYSESGIPSTLLYDETNEHIGVYIQDYHKLFSSALCVTGSGDSFTCKKATAGDIRPYSVYGNDCSRVLVFQFAGQPWEMIILNEE